MVGGPLDSVGPASDASGVSGGQQVQQEDAGALSGHVVKEGGLDASTRESAVAKEPLATLGQSGRTEMEVSDLEVTPGEVDPGQGRGRSGTIAESSLGSRALSFDDSGATLLDESFASMASSYRGETPPPLPKSKPPPLPKSKPPPPKGKRPKMPTSKQPPRPSIASGEKPPPSRPVSYGDYKTAVLGPKSGATGSRMMRLKKGEKAVLKKSYTPMLVG